MKKTFAGFVACSMAVALLATAAHAKPKFQVNEMSASEKALAALAGPGSIIDSDFEQPLWCPGFFCGPEFAACDSAGGTQAATGDCSSINTPNRAGWWTSSLNRQCSEPHVSTANPYAGSQHIRFEPDLSLTSPCGVWPDGDFLNEDPACRQAMYSPTDDQPSGPATLAFEVAINAGLGGHALQVTLRDSDLNGSYFVTGFNGQYVMVNVNSSGFQYNRTGLYKTMEFSLNPCTCAGTIYYDGILMGDITSCSYFGEGLSSNLEFVSFLSNNGAGTIDIDNLRIIRGECPPPECGNSSVEPGEECDPPGMASDDCDGRECFADCTCECAPGDVGCSGDLGDAVPLDNGSHEIVGPSGGWYIYDIDSPAVGINTCGEDFNNIDTFLWVEAWYQGQFLGIFGYNDDCDAGPFGYGQSDVYASCYGRAGSFCDGGANNGFDCTVGGDQFCISGYACSGGGNAGQQCNINNGDADCQGYCAGNPAIDAGTMCMTNEECQSTLCTSGPVFLQGQACSAPGADDECTALACGYPACENVGVPCTDDADCGGNANEFNFCQEIPGTCETIGECSQEGSCVGDSSCEGPYMDSPYESCLCITDAVGLQALIQMNYFSDIEEGDQFTLNLEKRRTCAEPITTGMCCDVVNGTCEDGLTDPGQCTSGVFVETKDCNPASCPLRLGACCDSFGVCTDTYADLPESHAGLPGVPLPLCQPGAAACAQGPDCQWTEGAACDEVQCFARYGACCNSNLGPLAAGLPGECTDKVAAADCDGDYLTFHVGQTCGQIECVADFIAIPTVSEWGLVVLTLLLLIGAKVYFGRRAATA